MEMQRTKLERSHVPIPKPDHRATALRGRGRKAEGSGVQTGIPPLWVADYQQSAKAVQCGERIIFGVMKMPCWLPTGQRIRSDLCASPHTKLTQNRSKT